MIARRLQRSLASDFEMPEGTRPARHHLEVMTSTVAPRIETKACTPRFLAPLWPDVRTQSCKEMLVFGQAAELTREWDRVLEPVSWLRRADYVEQFGAAAVMLAIRTFARPRGAAHATAIDAHPCSTISGDEFEKGCDPLGRPKSLLYFRPGARYGVECSAQAFFH